MLSVRSQVKHVIQGSDLARHVIDDGLWLVLDPSSEVFHEPVSEVPDQLSLSHSVPLIRERRTKAVEPSTVVFVTHAAHELDHVRPEIQDEVVRPVGLDPKHVLDDAMED